MLLPFKSKSAKILNDLSSKDVDIANKAKAMLFVHEFIQRDVNALFQALRKEYQDDNESSWSTRSLMFNRLAEMNDLKTVDFVTEIYPKLPPNREILSSALCAVVSFKSQESMKIAFDLMSKYHKKVRINYPFIFKSVSQTPQMKKHIFGKLCEVSETIQERLSL